EEDKVSSGHERRWQTVVGYFDLDLAGERGFGHRGKRVELDDVILAESIRPMRAQGRHALAQARPHIEFGPVALPIVEPDGLDAREAFERPGEADGRILSSREEDESQLRVAQSHFGDPE